MNTLDINKEKIIANFKTIVADTEELLKATTHQAGDKIDRLKFKLIDRVNNVRTSIEKAEDVVIDEAKHAVEVTNEYVHRKPWQLIVAAAGVGAILGFILRRGR
jgi:ElaB/YqjD/DUF883 family membrane-anchored ribosome-binding protein